MLSTYHTERADQLIAGWRKRAEGALKVGSLDVAAAILNCQRELELFLQAEQDQERQWYGLDPDFDMNQPGATIHPQYDTKDYQPKKAA